MQSVVRFVLAYCVSKFAGIKVKFCGSITNACETFFALQTYDWLIF